MADHIISCQGPLAVGDRLIVQVNGTPPVDPPIDPPIDPPVDPPSGEYTLVYMPWANGHKDGVPIEANGTIAIKTTTGANASPQNNPPNLTVSEWAGVNPGRVACLSYKPNNFSEPIPAMFGNNWPTPSVGTIQAIFSVVTAQMGYAVVQKNTTIYLNVKDTSGTASQVRITLATKE